MFYEKTLLDNGVTVASESMSGVRTVALGLWVRVGNRDELGDEHGLTHFIEHMLFKGTKTRSAADISAAFDSMGAELNAFTTREFTCFYARMIDEELAEGFEVLADMLENPLFGSAEIELEKQVVLEEIACSEDQPEEQVFDLLAKTMRPNSSLGLPVLGSHDSVSSFSRSQLIAFHGKHYVAENLTVVACGNVKHEELVELAKRYFSRMQQGSRTEREYKACHLAKPLASLCKKTEQAHLLVGYESVSISDERRFAHFLLDLILGGSMSSRLFQQIRELRGLAYDVYTSLQAYEDCGTFFLYAATRPENIAEVLSVAKLEIERIVLEGVTEEELNRAKEFACGNLVLGLETPKDHMIRLGRLLTFGIEVNSTANTLERYRGVRVCDVNDAARQLLKSMPTIAIVSSLENKEVEALVQL